MLPFRLSYHLVIPSDNLARPLNVRQTIVSRPTRTMAGKSLYDGFSDIMIAGRNDGHEGCAFKLPVQSTLVHLSAVFSMPYLKFLRSVSKEIDGNLG